MIDLYDHVRIKDSGITGIVVDIRKTNAVYCTVEDDNRAEEASEDGLWPLYDCKIEDLELISEKQKNRSVAPTI